MKRTVNRIEFNVGQAIQAAWDHIWSYNLKIRGTREDWRNRSYYTTATDIERKVRNFAFDTQQGVPWGTNAYGGSIRFTGNLFEAVRDWVSQEMRRGRIKAHNFGRGHISGQHLRPADQPIGPTEAKVTPRKLNPTSAVSPNPNEPTIGTLSMMRTVIAPTAPTTAATSPTNANGRATRRIIAVAPAARPRGDPA